MVVTDSVPTGMRFISASPGCIYDAGPPETVTCAVGDLADDASTEVTVTLRPRRALAGETVPNAGTVGGDQPDPNLADNSDVTTVDVLAQADLQLLQVGRRPDRRRRRDADLHAVGLQRGAEHRSDDDRRGPAADRRRSALGRA